MATIDVAPCPLCNDTPIPVVGLLPETKEFIAHTVTKGTVSWTCPNSGIAWTSAHTVGNILEPPE